MTKTYRIAALFLGGDDNTSRRIEIEQRYDEDPGSEAAFEDMKDLLWCEAEETLHDLHIGIDGAYDFQEVPS